MNRDREYLLDAIQACTLILEFSQGQNQETFNRDLKTQSSILYQLTILGEATNRLSLEYQSINPQVPIAAMRGMRNRIVHEFDTPQPKGVGILGSTKPLNQSTLQCFNQRWDSPQA